MGDFEAKTDWETFAGRMFSLLMAEHRASAAFVTNFHGLVLASRGDVPPKMPKPDRSQLATGPIAARLDNGTVAASGQVGANAILWGIFPTNVTEGFALAAIQAILLIL